MTTTDNRINLNYYSIFGDHLIKPSRHPGVCILLRMQPEHKCSQDCETLHKEIFKKIIIIILSGRTTSPSSSTKNNWVNYGCSVVSFYITLKI